MKNLLLTAVLAIANIAVAQTPPTSGPEYECLRYRNFGSESVKLKKYSEAASNYLKAEAICGNFDKIAYTRLIDCYRNAISGEKDPLKKKLLVDTVLTVYDKAQAKLGLDDSWYLIRGLYQISSTVPDYKKADLNLATGLQKGGLTVADYFVTSYYGNINKLYSLGTVEEKVSLKQRLLTEYFILTKLVTDAKMKPETQVSLNNTLSLVLKTYPDFQPELKANMHALPKEKEAKKEAVKNLMNIMEVKKWQDNKEYEMLSDTLLAIEPSADAYFAKAKTLYGKKRYQDGLDAIRKAKDYTPSAEQKVEMEYYTFNMYIGLGRKKDAYDMSKSLDGKYRSEGLKYRAQYVASQANSCGTTTFERKCNYYYAYQLASEAGATSLMAQYKKLWPKKDEMFRESKKIGDSISLSCWGVSVTLK
jgi:hypothetical protein